MPLPLVVATALWIGPPPPPRLSSELHTPGPHVGGVPMLQRGDGSFEHRDRKHGFIATVHKDGHVTFRDVAIAGGKVQVAGVDLRTFRARIPDGRLPSNTLVRPQDYGSLGDDGLVKNGPYGPAPILVGIGGSMAGLADIAASAHHGAAKARFLDETSALREKMAEEHRRSAEREALMRLSGELAELWNDRTAPASVRRERLFLRWDDAVEIPVAEGASADEVARGRAGEHARRHIEAFVRKHLPRGGVDGFTKAELAGMNARRKSRSVFDPYTIVETAEPSSETPASPPSKPPLP